MRVDELMHFRLYGFTVYKYEFRQYSGTIFRLHARCNLATIHACISLENMEILNIEVRSATFFHRHVSILKQTLQEKSNETFGLNLRVDEVKIQNQIHLKQTLIQNPCTL